MQESFMSDDIAAHTKQTVDKDGSSPDPAQKRRRIQMGPQECLEYANTPQGAASLTNPQSFQRAKQGEASSTSSSVQRGRTNGSCFIPGARTEHNNGVITATSSPTRQYISPSKGANAQPPTGNVYNSSGYAHIGSPQQRRSMQFPEAKVVNQRPSCSSEKPVPRTMVTNNFRKRSEPKEGQPFASSKVNNLDTSASEDLPAGVQSPRSSYSASSCGHVSTDSPLEHKSEEVRSDQSGWQYRSSTPTTPPRTGMTTKEESTTTTTTTTYWKATTNSPTKVQLRGNQFKFKSNTPKKSSTLQFGTRKTNVEQGNQSPCFSQSLESSKLPFVSSTSSKFIPTQAPTTSFSSSLPSVGSAIGSTQPFVSSTSSKLIPTQAPTTSFSSSLPADGSAIGSTQPFVSMSTSSKLIPTQAPTTSSSSGLPSVGSAGKLSQSKKSSEFQKCKEPSSCPAKTSSPFKQVPLTNYFVLKTSPVDVNIPESSLGKGPLPGKKSVSRSLNKLWDKESKNSHSSNNKESKQSNLQRPMTAMPVSAGTTASPGKRSDDRQQVNCVSTSPSSSGKVDLASSLEAFEDEDTFDDLDITDEGTVIYLQSSQEKSMEAEDGILPEETSKRFEDQVDGGGAWIEEMVESGGAAIPLKARTYGLVGDGQEEPEDQDQDYFAKLPPEIIENIFCRIPIVNLLRSCFLVCRRWWNIISNESFIIWKKSYMKCKNKEAQWRSPLADARQETCLLDVIRYLPRVNRTPVESTSADLAKHSKYTFAKDLIAENLPELMTTDEHPHPWSVVAAIAILAETVSDVREVLTCLLHSGSTNATTTVTEVLYCIATLLLHLQRRHNLCRRLHFRVFYALFLFENDVKLSSVQVKDSTPEVQWKKAKAGNLKFPLTQEQLRVVNHRLRRRENEVVKVIAFAGTGKTTTLIKFAEANPCLHLLYVAFNKTVQVEASRTFPGNTECRTTHSLAYRKLKHRYRNKVTFDLKPFTVRGLLSQRPKSDKSKLHWAVYSRMVGDSVKCFMSSADEYLTTRHVPDRYTTANKPQEMLSHQDRMAILGDAEYLWERMIDEKDQQAKITHDGYLKVYQLSKPIISDVDCLLIDEAQDLTAGTLKQYSAFQGWDGSSDCCHLGVEIYSTWEELFRPHGFPNTTLNSTGHSSQPADTKILVGDPHQQIYSFRGARNAMNNIQADTVYHLTQSFRFGSEIAYLANCILDVFKDMTDQTIIGKEEDGSLCGQQIGQKAIICRGNVTIFKEAVRLTSMENHSHRRLGFTGGFDYEKLTELYKMHTGSCGIITNEFFRKMKSFHKLEEYAHNADDVELLGLISIVKMYSTRLPELIENIKDETVSKLQHATIVLTTAHKAKGLEFDTVQLADDFSIFGPSVVPVEGGVMITENVNLSEDEKNLIYVAVTRAKKSLLLSESLKKCLGKTSEQFKFPMSTKVFLEEGHTDSKCLDCGQPITSLERVAMAKLWSVKTSKVCGSLYHPHPTINGGHICSKCAYHHLPGFQRIFLGDKEPPKSAQIDQEVHLL